MKLKYRRILYLSFITAFIIITPLVILYTAGYGYNFKKGRIEKTGILYVDSKPKEADIYINGQFSGKTDKRFPAMLPDKYQLEVKKNGYHSWQKEIEIKSNLTEFAEDIVLFKDALPINLVEGQIKLFVASPDQRKIIYSSISSTTEDLIIMDLKNKSTEKLKSYNLKNKPEIEFLNCSTEKNLMAFKVISNDPESYLIVNTQTNITSTLSNPPKDTFLNLDWGLDKDVFLYGLGQKGLYRIDQSSQKTELILSGNILSFTFDKNTLFYITQENGNNYLNKKVFGVNESEKLNDIKKIKLPINSNFSLRKSPSGYITLLDRLSHDLFIISDKSFESEDIENNIILQDKANDLTWSKGGGQVLFYNDFEIWTYDFLSQQKNLLTRYGQIIKKARWYPDNKYVIYLVNNKIGTIEANSSKIKNDTILAEISEINDYVLEDRGQDLFILGRAGNKIGTYQLQLQ